MHDEAEVETEEIDRVQLTAALLRELSEEELAEVFSIAQITMGWMRLKKGRILPLTEGGEEGSDQWWSYADELHLPSLGVDGTLAAVIHHDKKQKVWVTDANEGIVAFDDLYAAMEFCEAQAVENGWVIRFCGPAEEFEEGEVSPEELMGV